MGLFKHKRKVSQLEYQMIGIRNDELDSPYLGSKLDIISEILSNYRKIDDAIEAGYDRDSIANAISVLNDNGFKVDMKKRRIVRG